MNDKKYLKHPAGFMNDPRVQEMIRVEGNKSYGIFWALMEELAQAPYGYLPMANLSYLACRANTRRPACVKRIIQEYGLFNVEGGMFYAVDSWETMGISAAQVKKNIAKRIRSRAKTNQKCTGNSTEKRTGNSTEERTGNSTENVFGGECNLQISKEKTHFPRVRTRISVVDDNNIISDNINNNNSKNAPTPSASGKPEPVQIPWGMLVDTLNEERPWMEHTWASAGLPPSQLNHRKRILKFFIDHIRTYAKEDELKDTKAVKRYFANFISASSITGRRLREALRQWDAPAETSLAQPADNPGAQPADNPHQYRFEDRTDGPRTYLGGIPIPDDAPPRPSHEAWWDDEKQDWI